MSHGHPRRPCFLTAARSSPTFPTLSHLNTAILPEPGSCRGLVLFVASDPTQPTRQGLSNVLWSLAASSHVPDDHVIQAVIQEVSKRDLSDFTDQGLSNILWACAEFNFRPGPAVLQALLAEAIGRQSLPSQAIANTLWALAVFDALEPLVRPELG